MNKSMNEVNGYEWSNLLMKWIYEKNENIYQSIYDLIFNEIYIIMK